MMLGRALSGFLISFYGKQENWLYIIGRYRCTDHSTTIMPYRRMSETTKDRIITLNDLGLGPKSIRGILQKEGGSNFQLPAVSTILSSKEV